MSKILLQIKEAKITCTDTNKPAKYNDPATKEFKSFNFDICPTLSKKTTNNEWETKIMVFRCTMWNEALADKFIFAFDPKYKNYITILNGQLNNFHTEPVQKTSNNGISYTLNSYMFLNIIVNDFVITQRSIDNDKIGVENNIEQEKFILNDEIPF